MGYLRSARPPSKYDPSYMKTLVETIRTAVNFMDTSNFPDDGLPATIIRKRTVGLAHLVQGEFHLPLTLLADPKETTSTSWVLASGFIYWDPLVWGTECEITLEVTGGPLTTGTAEFRLLGAGATEIAKITTTEVGLVYCTTAVTPPEGSQQVLLQMRTTNAAVTAAMLSARLKIKGGN